MVKHMATRMVTQFAMCGKTLEVAHTVRFENIQGGPLQYVSENNSIFMQEPKKVPYFKTATSAIELSLFD